MSDEQLFSEVVLLTGSQCGKHLSLRTVIEYLTLYHGDVKFALMSIPADKRVKRETKIILYNIRESQYKPIELFVNGFIKGYDTAKEGRVG